MLFCTYSRGSDDDDDGCGRAHCFVFDILTCSRNNDVNLQQKIPAQWKGRLVATNNRSNKAPNSMEVSEGPGKGQHRYRPTCDLVNS